MCSATATSLPLGVEQGAAEADLGGEADGVQGAVDAVPPLAQLGDAARSNCGGVADVELEHVGLASAAAGGAPGQRQAPPERR